VCASTWRIYHGICGWVNAEAKCATSENINKEIYQLNEGSRKFLGEAPTTTTKVKYVCSSTLRTN
jgi:hypothetical protein